MMTWGWLEWPGESHSGYPQINPRWPGKSWRAGNKPVALPSCAHKAWTFSQLSNALWKSGRCCEFHCKSGFSSKKYNCLPVFETGVIIVCTVDSRYTNAAVVHTFLATRSATSGTLENGYGSHGPFISMLYLVKMVIVHSELLNYQRVYPSWRIPVGIWGYFHLVHIVLVMSYWDLWTW